MGSPGDDGRAALSGTPPQAAEGAVRKRSVSIAGHATSVSLEAAFWNALGRIAAAEGVPLSRLVERVDATRAPGVNLSSALRVFVLERVTNAPHQRDAD